jgi:disulfide oxidoreductase YuzD
MNIDSNTLVTFITLCGGAYFAIGYFRMKLNDRFNTVVRNHDEQIMQLYLEQEKLWGRVVALEKCCADGECKTNKNYYNTTA